MRENGGVYKTGATVVVVSRNGRQFVDNWPFTQLEEELHIFILFKVGNLAKAGRKKQGEFHRPRCQEAAIRFRPILILPEKRDVQYR